MGKLLKYLIFTLPFLLVFFSSLYHPQDPDLGWHLKYGEHSIKTGQILKENIYSTEMPNYRWVNSSWLTDLITYSVFDNFGFFGLSIVAAAVITATFFFFSKAADLDFWQQSVIFPLTLIFISPLNSVSFRGQLLSLMLLGILYWFLTLYEKSKSKIIFLVPILFALWSNIHGQFLLGLAFLFLWSISYLIINIWQNKISSLKENFSLSLTLLFSPLAVLINPFGFGVYLESFKHFSNPLLKSVAEWLPVEDLSPMWLANTVIGFLIFFALLIVVFSEDLKVKLKDFALSGPFFVMSFIVRRYSWPMFYISFSAIKHSVGFIKPASKTASYGLGIFILAMSFTFVFFALKPHRQIQNISWDSYCSKSLGCSKEAAEFLVKNKPEGNFMNLYAWGGWLVWNYPEIKPSIDGRMHLWNQDGYSAFREYYEFEQNQKDINNSKYNVVLMSKDKPVYERLKKLSVLGKWKLAYEDETSVIYIRNGVF